jgi:predicted nucleotidyltransferase
MTYGLKDTNYRAIMDILRGHSRIEKAVLFGSRATGTFSPESDVDICLFGDALTLSDHAGLATAMENLTMAQRVDLHLYRNIKEDALLTHIRCSGKILFDRQAKDSGCPADS